MTVSLGAPGIISSREVEVPGEAHDRRLLQQWRSGDVQAGDELFSRHYPGVLRFFANKIDAGVEDLVQAAFTRCLEAAGRLTQDTCFRAYLFGICRHILFDSYRRKQGAPQAIDSEHESVASLGAGPSTIITNRQQERLLLEALRSLPLDSQILLELYYWENMSGRELGEFLDVPENTARSRVRKARERVVEALEQLAADSELRGIQAKVPDDLDRWAVSVREKIDVG